MLSIYIQDGFEKLTHSEEVMARADIAYNPNGDKGHSLEYKVNLGIQWNLLTCANNGAGATEKNSCSKDSKYDNTTPIAIDV